MEIKTSKHIKIKINSQSGSAMLISVIFFLFISLAIIAGLVGPTVREFKNANLNLDSKKSYFLAESGSEDAMYRIKNNLTIDGSETLNLDSSLATTNITTISEGYKQITTLGDVSSYQRKTNIKLSTGVGLSFTYGMQVGNGGLIMSNTATINGSVYVNGDIVGSNSAKITGTAIAADRTAEIIDQINDTGTPTDVIQFGTAVNTQDVAQSFIVATSDIATQVSVYIKKVGGPSDVNVRITADSSGKPANTSLATGTLSASNVATSYGWVNIVLSPNVTLATNTTYWLVLDASVNASNYYILGANNAQYVSGLAKLGQYGTTTWNNTNPSGLDAFFKIYLGGVNSTISGMIIGQFGIGNASAHTVNNSTIAGNLYCQTGSGNNKSCNVSQGDPAPLNFPISDSQIQTWKDEAVAGGTQGEINLSNNSTLIVGPKKINGNLILSNNAVLTVSGTLWVTGNISLSNSSQLKLSNSYGSASGVIISDGTISTANSASFSGSSTSGSYIMVLTTSTSSSAINIANSAGTVILAAPYGTILFSNTASVKEAIAKTIIMSNSSTLIYDSGLISKNFIGGPSGAWRLDGWGETQ
ncbi:hypothetical protein EXS45_00155 [Candidatus Nomurabacteria bacterium]|nr:hypothetical protein [Candidatus Nomurabacteria bacterium]